MKPYSSPHATTAAIALLLFLASTPSPFASSARAASRDDDGLVLLRQTFEDPRTVFDDWAFDDLAQVGRDPRGAGGHSMRVSYPPAHNGSPRVVQRFDLNDSASSATLSFDMKLHRKFEFVRGGKIHGLGGGTATSGCTPIDEDGWSVRLKWREHGVPEIYVYHQDRVARCGDQFAAEDFRFERDRWYRIDLQVVRNSGPQNYDGRAVLYIDGERVVKVKGLRLSGETKVDIDQFLFSTFYGGGSSDYSPSRTNYIYYDNFSVHRGRVVTGEEGAECELYSGGIYDPRKRVCQK